MPTGYSKSTSNTRSLVERGKRRRGDVTDKILDCHATSIAPVGPIESAVTGGGLLPLDWSLWMPVIEGMNKLKKNDVGLYLLRRKGADRLIYIGEGKIRGRVNAHLRKGIQSGHPQASAFSDTPSIELSFHLPHLPAKHRLLEIENDLIAAHILQLGTIPTAQFQG
jgi:hypothetical protein